MRYNTSIMRTSPSTNNLGPQRTQTILSRRYRQHQDIAEIAGSLKITQHQVAAILWEENRRLGSLKYGIVKAAETIGDPRKLSFLAEYRQSGKIKEAAESVGIPRRTHYHWLETDPRYQEAVAEAQIEAGDRIVANVLARLNRQATTRPDFSNLNPAEIIQAFKKM